MREGRNFGFTLPEVAISIVVLTLGLMAIVSMQTSSAVYSAVASSSTQALMLAKSDMEKMQNTAYSKICSTSYSKTMSNQNFKLVRNVSPNKVENDTVTLNISVKWGNEGDMHEANIVGLISK